MQRLMSSSATAIRHNVGRLSQLQPLQEVKVPAGGKDWPVLLTKVSVSL
jgi:hypothetical protein